jgi:tungstate transport system permease protein
MDLLSSSLIAAIQLVFSFDQELLSIVYISLKVSCIATIIASLAGVPMGFFVAFAMIRNF